MTESLVKIDGTNQRKVQAWIKKKEVKEPIVDFCCCGCSLRTGCLAIGWICLIGVMIAIGVIVFLIHTLVSLDLNHDNVLPKNAVFSLSAYVTVVTIAVAVEGVMGFTLLIGIHKAKANYLHSFVIFSIAKIIFAVVATIVRVAWITFGITLQDYISTPIGIAVTAYFAVVVESYKRVLLRNQVDSLYNWRHDEELPPKYDV